MNEKEKKKNSSAILSVNSDNKLLHPNEANNPCLTNSRWGMSLVLGRYVQNVIIILVGLIFFFGLIF